MFQHPTSYDKREPEHIIFEILPRIFNNNIRISTLNRI